MKDMTRSYRRYTKWVKFKRRVYNWTKDGYYINSNEKEELRDKIFKGESSNWLRTTGRPCNCYMCCYDKFKRPSKQEVQCIIDEFIDY